MPLGQSDREFRREAFRLFDFNMPLEPGSQYYEPLYRLEGGDDPVALLQEKIEFSSGESRQFFSGFRGSGKTTELKRLKQSLESDGYLVFYCDILDYLNPGQAIDISDLLIVIAGAFSDEVEKQFPGVDLKADSYWTRFWHYLTTTEVIAQELKLTALKDVAELKLALKDVPTFRQKLQEVMANRLFEFLAQVQKFFEDYVKKLDQLRPGQEIVFLVDALEQLRGSLINEQEVIASVGRLFSLHMDRLRIPYLHVVYSVPPWLKFVQPGAEVVILHSVRQWGKDANRTPHGPGDKCLLDLLRKRLGANGFTRFFGDEARAMQFVNFCGGNVRDLLRLMREAIIRAQVLPITDQVVNASIITVRSSLLPIAADEAAWLNAISETHESGLPNMLSASIMQFTRFLDSHQVLYLRNGEEWYDVHPLIREEVAELARKNAPQP